MTASETDDRAKQQSELSSGVSESAPTAQPSSGPGLKTLALALIVSLAVSVGAWALAESFRNAETGGGTKGGRTAIPVSVYATQNGIMSYGILGAALALTLGVVGTLVYGSRSIPLALLAGVTGLVVGGAGGAASSYFLFPIYYANERTADVTLSMVVHLGIWAVIGAATGLAFGIGTGNRAVLLRSLIGGIVGAALATLLFDIAGAFFPMAHTERPLSQDAITRFAAVVLFSLFIVGWLIVTAFQKPRAVAKTA
jgi:hypothetical protein